MMSSRPSSATSSVSDLRRYTVARGVAQDERLDSVGFAPSSQRPFGRPISSVTSSAKCAVGLAERGGARGTSWSVERTSTSPAPNQSLGPSAPSATRGEIRAISLRARDHGVAERRRQLCPRGRMQRRRRQLDALQRRHAPCRDPRPRRRARRSPANAQRCCLRAPARPSRPTPRSLLKPAPRSRDRAPPRSSHWRALRWAARPSWDHRRSPRSAGGRS